MDDFEDGDKARGCALAIIFCIVFWGVVSAATYLMTRGT